MVAPSFHRSARRALDRLIRLARRVEQRRVGLEPDDDPLGRVLLSYVVDPFLLRDEAAIDHAHTQDWESWTIARTWLELGFAVDVIHWTHRDFVPSRPYDVVIDPRQNLEAGARYLSELLLKYVHDDYQVRKAIAAYNAGPGAVSRYQGVPPYRETREYVERVIRQWQPRKDATK